MRNHQASCPPVQDQLEQLLEAFLAIVLAAAGVADNLGAPSLRGAIGLESGVLAVQVGLLVLAGHSGVTDGQRTGDGDLVVKQVRRGVVPGTAARLSRRQQLAGGLPLPQLCRRGAKNPGSLAYFHQPRFCHWSMLLPIRCDYFFQLRTLLSLTPARPTVHNGPSQSHGEIP